MRIAAFRDDVIEHVLRFIAHPQIAKYKHVVLNRGLQDISREPAQTCHCPDITSLAQRPLSVRARRFQLCFEVLDHGFQYLESSVFFIIRLDEYPR